MGWLTAKEISKLYNIPEGTLAYWRHQRRWDNTLPRFHRLRRRVYYVKEEFEVDLRAMFVSSAD